jgi:26S proteasome regulatory subunit N10
MCCAGKSPEVLVTLTSDLGKVLSSLHEVKLGGKFDFVSSMQVAQLVLKHRQNKNQHQRVIVFVGSPIPEDSNSLVRLAKRLKKNNIAVDVVNFGEEAVNTEKLEAFIAAVNSNDNSHLVTIPPGPHILSDILISSPIIAGEEGGSSMGGSSAGANDFGPYGGVDPNLEPELALALKVSMEEERARQEEAKKKMEAEKGPEEQKPSQTAAESTPQSKEVEMSDAAEEDEDLLAQAIALSMQAEKKPQPEAPSPAPVSSATSDVQMQDDDDEEMRLAMQMSLASGAPAAPAAAPSGGEDISKDLMEDPNFVNSILMSLPGVDPDDDRIKSALKQLEQKKDQK